MGPRTSIGLSEHSTASPRQLHGSAWPINAKAEQFGAQPSHAAARQPLALQRYGNGRAKRIDAKPRNGHCQGRSLQRDAPARFSRSRQWHSKPSHRDGTARQGNGIGRATRQRAAKKSPHPLSVHVSNPQIQYSRYMKIRITFTEELLGTASANPDIHREFIASKAPDAATIEDEVAAVGAAAVADKVMTVFPRTNGEPHLYDYQIKGFLKDACGSLARAPGTLSNKTKAYKKVIDGLIFVFPRIIKFAGPAAKISNCQRPLRAETAQGPRVALANSETIPLGTSLECEIRMLDPKLEPFVRELLDYGQLRGLGQWRNSGKGRFNWEELSNGIASKSVAQPAQTQPTATAK